MTQFPFSSGSQFFTSPNVGYVAGLYGYISKTTDGGTTWHYLTTGVSNNLSCLYFPTAQIGFAAGHNIIIKTNDSGGSWSVKYSGQLQFNSIFFTDSLNGYAMDANPYEIAMLKTLDGGETWTPVTPSLTNYPLSYVFFTNPDTGYIVGYNGVLLKTSTGGLSTGESNKFADRKMKIFPNPNNGTFFIDFPSTAEASTIKVINLSGVSILNSIVPGNNNKNEIQLPGIKPGLYIVKIISQSRVFT